MPARLRKRGDIWFATFYEFDPAGRKRRVERSTACTDRRAAEKVAAGFELSAADPASAAAAKTTIGDALKALVDERTEQAAAGRKASDTAAFYAKKAAQLSRVFEGDEDNYRPFPLAGLTAAKVDEYISQRRREGAGENTINKELITLRCALKLARRRGTWSGDPALVLPVAFAPEYKPRKRFLSAPEFEELLGQLDDDRAARVAFIVATSAEWGATERALREDVSGDQVHVRGTKRATRDRIVPLVFKRQQELMGFALQRAEGVDGKLFTPWSNVRRDLLQACERAGIPACSPNDLRRTFAHWVSGEGVPNEVIAPMMGHSDTRMLDRVYNKRTAAELAASVRLWAGIKEPKKKGGKKAKKGTADCRTGAAALAADAVPHRCRNAGADSGSSGGKSGPGNAKAPVVTGACKVPRDGIEPSTRGFSVHVRMRLTTRNEAKNEVNRKPRAAPVPQAPRLRVVHGGRRK